MNVSKNLKTTCKSPSCKYFEKEMYADFSSIKKHLHQKHGHQDLVNVAYEEGLITSKSGYISHDWLVEEIAKLCLLLETQ